MLTNSEAKDSVGKDDSNGTLFKVIELIGLTLANPAAKDTANALLQAPLAPGCQHQKKKITQT